MSDAAPLPQPCEPRWRARIEQAFVSASADDFQVLRAHLAQCDGCRATWDRLGHVDRALSGGARLPRAAEDRIAAAAIRAAAPSPRRSRFAALGGLVAAVALAAGLFIALDPLPEGLWRTRGEAEPRFVPRPPGVSMFCIAPPIEGAPARVRSTVRAALPSADVPTLLCHADDELQIAYGTPQGPPMFLGVFGRTAEGEAHWYAPSDGGATAVLLLADVVDQPLPWSTRLGVFHQPGTIELVVRFSDHSVVAESLARAPDALYELRAKLVIAPREEAP